MISVLKGDRKFTSLSLTKYILSFDLSYKYSLNLSIKDTNVKNNNVKSFTLLPESCYGLITLLNAAKIAIYGWGDSLD